MKTLDIYIEKFNSLVSTPDYYHQPYGSREWMPAEKYYTEAMSETLKELKRLEKNVEDLKRRLGC